MSFYNGVLNHDDIHGSGLRGLPGIGFKLDSNNDYDIQNKKLVNVKNGVNGSDVVTKSQLDTKTSLLDGARTHGYIVNNKAVIYSQSGAVHAKSFYLQDQNEDEVRILTDNQDFDNVHLFVPNLKNFDGFGGRERSEIMVSSVDQIIFGNKFFQNIKAQNPTEDGDVANKNYVDFKITKQNVLIDDGFVKKSGSLMTGDLILPHYNYPVQGNTNKAISYETQREIFISRKETFPMETSLDMNNNVIENIAEATSGHEALRKSQLDDALVIVNNDLSDKADKSYVDHNFFNRLTGGQIGGDIDMRGNTIKFLKFDKSDSAAARVVELKLKVNKSGDAMTGDLNMNGSNIKNVGINLSDDTTAVPRSYVDSFVNSAIHNPLDGDLYANNHQIKNLKTPSEDNDAVTKKYFEDQLLQSHLLPSHKDNAFKYLLDQDESSSERNIIVNGIVDFNESPHKNKKAYDIDLIYTQGTQNYDSQIGINIYQLPIGKFTIIMEYYYPENIGITVSCQASTAIINKQISKNFSDYIKLLVQFEDQKKATPDYLYFNIRGSGTTSTNPEGYLVFYGMTEWLDSVNPEIYDHAVETSMFEYDNGNMKMNTVLDMNNKKITNLSDGTDANDAVNVSQMDRLENEIIPLQTFIKNQIYIRIFKLHFYDLKEPILYRFSPPNLTGISNVWTPTEGLSFSSSSQGGLTINSLDPIKGLQFDSNMKILLNLGNTVGQSTPYTILISMTLKDKITLHFSNSTNSNDFRYPGYIIDYATEKLIFERQSGNYGVVSFPSKLKNKQVMIWIKFNPTSRHYQLNLAHVTTLDTHEYPLSHFTATKLCIVPGNNIMNKICYLNSYIDNADHFHHLIFEEKKKGSYFE